MNISRPASAEHTASLASGPARKLLSFCLGSEEYGLDILAVREIIGLISITPLPRTPAHVKGVINLRGKIIPVIELRARFGLATVPDTEETCIIVVDVPAEGEGDARQMGVVVDSVREVLDIPLASIEPPPTFGGSIPMDYITGIGKVKEKVIIMLDTAKVMSTSGLADCLPPARSDAIASDVGASGSSTLVTTARAA